MITAKILIPGTASAALCLLSRPLSLWGGYDVHTGRIIDSTHPEVGLKLAGKVLAMKEARGSSSSSSALVEAARCGTAPAAIILGRLDPILVIGSLVAMELYGISIPIVLVPLDAWSALQSARSIKLTAEGVEPIN